MVKKQKAPRGSNTSKRTRSANATARRPGAKAVKKKLRTTPARIVKKQKPKSKRRTGLHAQGGGNATAAGVTFQASVGAVFAVQMLTQSFGDEQLGLVPFKAQSIR